MQDLGLIEQFSEMLAAEKNSAIHTIQAYRLDVMDFLNFITPKSAVAAQQKDFRDYLRLLDHKGAARRTVARKLSSLKQFFLFLLSEGYISDNPLDTIESPKLVKSLPKILSEDEIERLLKTAGQLNSPEGIRLSAMLEILYATGLRVSELISLSLQSLLISETGVNLLMVKGKGRKERALPLPSVTLEALNKYLQIREFFTNNGQSIYLFPSNSKSGYLTRQHLWRYLKQLAFDANIDPGKISPHVIRHAFATHLINNGADLVSVQKLLGHEDITTTEIYTHVATDRLTNLVNTCHPLAKLAQQ